MKTAGLSQGIKAPQQPLYKTISVSPVRNSTTVYNLKNKKNYTQEEPIVKVTTEKQVYYPALYKETEEYLQINEKPGFPVSHTYVRTSYQDNKFGTINYNEYEKDRYYEDRERKHRNTISPYRESRRRPKTKKYDKYHKTLYVPAQEYTIQPVPALPTQTLVPMYTHVPTYPSPPTYTTYHTIDTKYGYSPTYYDRKGSGR